MKSIEGYVCIGKIQELRIVNQLIGPKTGSKDLPHNYQPFRTNGLTPFTNENLAAQALLEMRRVKSWNGEKLYKKTWLAKIAMRVVESEDFDSLGKDVPDFIGRRDLIIVEEQDFGDFLLLGSKCKGASGVAEVPVSDLEENGFKTLTYRQVFELSYGNALREVRRQGHTLAWPSTFRLIRLNSTLYLKGLT